MAGTAIRGTARCPCFRLTGQARHVAKWKPVTEQRLGQPLAATMRGGSVSWEMGRQGGPAIG
ncbi:TPA: hypothetical protein L6A97_24580 [Pseudomonas aeruginosa]|nr:hypothetical protein [Pseudomonas aeruginosa]